MLPFLWFSPLAHPLAEPFPRSEAYAERNESGKGKAISVEFSLFIMESSNVLISWVLFFLQLLLALLLWKDEPELCGRGAANGDRRGYGHQPALEETYFFYILVNDSLAQKPSCLHGLRALQGELGGGSWNGFRLQKELNSDLPLHGLLLPELKAARCPSLAIRF